MILIVPGSIVRFQNHVHHGSWGIWLLSAGQAQWRGGGLVLTNLLNASDDIFQICLSRTPAADVSLYHGWGGVTSGSRGDGLAPSPPTTWMCLMRLLPYTPQLHLTVDCTMNTFLSGLVLSSSAPGAPYNTDCSEWMKPELCGSHIKYILYSANYSAYITQCI